MTEIPDRYLGDGVYARFDGYQIWLRTATVFGEIALEPEVLGELVRYFRDIKEIVNADARQD